MLNVDDKVIVIRIKEVSTDKDMVKYIGVSGVISEIKEDRNLSGIKTEYNTFVNFNERSNLEGLYFSKDELMKC